MDRPIRNCGASTRFAEARRRRQMRTTGNPCIPPAKDSQFSMRRTAISDAEKAKEVLNLQRAPKPKPPFPEQRMPRTPPPCAHRHWQTCGQPLDSLLELWGLGLRRAQEFQDASGPRLCFLYFSSWAGGAGLLSGPSWLPHSLQSAQKTPRKEVQRC